MADVDSSCTEHHCPSARAVYDLQLRAHGHDPSLIESEEVIAGILSEGLSVSVDVGGQCAAYALVHRCNLGRDGVPRLHEPPAPPTRTPSGTPPAIPAAAASCSGGAGEEGEEGTADVFLHDLCVDPEFRGLGLSASLVRVLLRRHPRLHLVSLPESLSFWRHAGARETDPPRGERNGQLPSYPPGSALMLLRRRIEAGGGGGGGAASAARGESTLRLYRSGDCLAAASAASLAEAAPPAGGGGGEAEAVEAAAPPPPPK